MTQVAEKTPVEVSADTRLLWETYFPGLTPVRAYRAGLRDAAVRDVLARRVRAAAAARDKVTNDAELREWWQRVVDAKAEVLRHDGVPARWIDHRGEPQVPLTVCWRCWRDGADAVHHVNGRERGQHLACAAVAQIRSHLRCSVSTRLLWGEEDRARMWERKAHDLHDVLTNTEAPAAQQKGAAR